MVDNKNVTQVKEKYKSKF